MLILDGAGLLHVQRLLIIGQLTFQLIDFQFGGFAAGFILFLHFTGFSYDFILLFQAVGQLIDIAFIAFDFFLLAHCRLHQVKVVAGALVIGFQIAFCAVMLSQFARHFNVAILLGF